MEIFRNDCVFCVSPNVHLGDMEAYFYISCYTGSTWKSELMMHMHTFFSPAKSINVIERLICMGSQNTNIGALSKSGFI